MARLTQPHTDLDPEAVLADAAQHDEPWTVTLHNDPVSLMSYVVMVLRRVFGFDVPTATNIMMTAHYNGTAVVIEASREDCLDYVRALHQYGLQATVKRA